MNHVLSLTRNNLALTMHMVESVEKQDIPTFLSVVDNYSTDGTRDWFKANYDGSVMVWGLPLNAGVSHGWNLGLERLFDRGAPHVLVINNDVILPPWFYSTLLSYEQSFISGIAVDKMEQIASPPERSPLVQHPDFSAFLIRREAWEKVGKFDERMKHYASDTSYHVEAHRKGVQLWKANVPFYHERSSTLNNASPEERAEIQAQANADREVFRSLYGVMPGDAGYNELFK